MTKVCSYCGNASTKIIKNIKKCAKCLLAFRPKPLKRRGIVC